MGTTRAFETEPILKHLLAKPDIILVTVQYRLGPLGETFLCIVLCDGELFIKTASILLHE